MPAPTAQGITGAAICGAMWASLPTTAHKKASLRSCYDAQRDPHVILSKAKNPLNQQFSKRFFVAMLLRMTVFLTAEVGCRGSGLPRRKRLAMTGWLGAEACGRAMPAPTAQGITGAAICGAMWASLPTIYIITAGFCEYKKEPAERQVLFCLFVGFSDGNLRVGADVLQEGIEVFFAGEAKHLFLILVEDDHQIGNRGVHLSLVKESL